MNVNSRPTRSSQSTAVLFVLAVAWTAWSDTATADDWAPARPAIFASASGRFGFKMLPRSSTGILFSIDDDGKDQVVWKKTLVNIPLRVFISGDGKRVVTVDTYADLGRKHSLVVYNEKGAVLADYELEDFLTDVEIRDRVPTSSPNRWWADEATFKFRLEGRDLQFFDVQLKWGKLIVVDLPTGDFVDSQQPAAK